MRYSRYQALSLSVAGHCVLHRLLQLSFELNWMRPSVAGQGGQVDGSRRGMSEQTTKSICGVILASDGIRFVADAKLFYCQPGF
jgi:hypothetical protein